MKKFRFSLATLLWHRESLEDKERTELLRIRYKHQVEQDCRKSLENKLRETLAELKNKRAASAEQQELVLFQRYIDRLHLEIEQSARRLAKLDQELERQRIRVIEATKNRKVLDALNDKKKKEYTLNMDRLEQKTVDELVVVRYANKQK
jgi:flagellar protein FliJ